MADLLSLCYYTRRFTRGILFRINLSDSLTVLFANFGLAACVLQNFTVLSSFNLFSLNLKPCKTEHYDENLSPISLKLNHRVNIGLLPSLFPGICSNIVSQ